MLAFCQRRANPKLAEWSESQSPLVRKKVKGYYQAYRGNSADWGETFSGRRDNLESNQRFQGNLPKHIKSENHKWKQNKNKKRFIRITKIWKESASSIE